MRMHYHRIFYVLIVFFACLNQSFATDDTERRNAFVKNYMDFAFLKNTKVLKFSKIPRVMLHCEQDYCLGISQEVVKHLPKYIESQITNNNSQASDINIYISILQIKKAFKAKVH